MKLNQQRPGHQRIADIYGLPVNIIRDPLNYKFIAWVGKPGASGAAIGPIVENNPAAEAARGSAQGSRPEESNADPRSVSTKSMRAKRVSNFYELVD
jgi:hypothetical protein